MISNFFSKSQKMHSLYVQGTCCRQNYGLQDHMTIAKIGKDIKFDPTFLDSYDFDGWKPVHHDLLSVCAAVEFADRRFVRSRNQWSRALNVTVPVLELETWQKFAVNEFLTGTLRHLTGDDWCFSFVQSEPLATLGHRQRPLPFGNNKKFTIPYSDGLDSRCIAGIFDSDMGVRVRVSQNKAKPKIGEGPFDIFPFQVKLRSANESSVRSRGFKFAAITAIAAQICGVSDIIIPESGQGALGPVLLPLHNVYADYRNYPTFFRMMEHFITTLMGYSVSYKQPRLWYTKGQTISEFLATSGKSPKTLLSTRSCWQQRQNVRGNGTVMQCGLCAACLLRRMSMHAARIDEPECAYTFGDLTASHYRDATQGFDAQVHPRMMMQYGSVGARHLQNLADLATKPDTTLRRYVYEIASATGISEEETTYNMGRLLVQHAEEWAEFLEALGDSSFLNGWAKGSRYGRSE